jgi:hypothetical protein
VCDGKYDCIDGTDENLSFYESCHQLTNYSGHFNSLKMNNAANNSVNGGIPLLHKTKTLLISVENNHTIWLSFKNYVNVGNHLLKVKKSLFIKH